MSDVAKRVEPERRSTGLELPEELRGRLRAHMERLRRAYFERGWGGRVGFGVRPAVVVIDLALGWTEPDDSMGSDLDSVVEATARVLDAARAARAPIFFTTGIEDPAAPPYPGRKKFEYRPGTDFEHAYRIDPRLGRRPDEMIIAKPYASSFKGTNLGEMLAALCVDTLVVTGCSTGHCVYATCRDAMDRFRVVVPREAVGDRCELMHEVNLLDIDVAIGDVMGVDDVVERLAAIQAGSGYSDRGMRPSSG